MLGGGEKSACRALLSPLQWALSTTPQPAFSPTGGSAEPTTVLGGLLRFIEASEASGL